MAPPKDRRRSQESAVHRHRPRSRIPLLQISNVTWSMNGERCSWQMFSDSILQPNICQLHRSPFMDHVTLLILSRPEFIHLNRNNDRLADLYVGRLPEVDHLGEMEVTASVIAKRGYGSGVRVNEALTLRIKDLD